MHVYVGNAVSHKRGITHQWKTMNRVWENGTFYMTKSKVGLLLQTIRAHTNQSIPDGLKTYIHE